MHSIKLSVRQCKDGDIIATDIISNQGVLICPENTVINGVVKKNLINWGIEDLWIIRPFPEESEEYTAFRREHDNSTRELAAFTKNLIFSGSAELDSLNLLSNRIFKDISNNQNLLHFLDKIKEFDQSIFSHCINVAFYSALICKWLNIEEHKTKNIIITGLLHDLGKIQIPAGILNKSGKLNPKEVEIIKSHPLLGYNILKDIVDMDSDIKLGVLLHHEREDGTGYPYSYTSKQINLNAKIIAVADTYDAMTSDRSYRKKSTPFNAFKTLQEECITSCDINIVNIFIRELSCYLIGAEVMLNTGDRGTIAHIPLHNIQNPIVNINSKILDLSKEPGLFIAKMACD